jgi:hypothetical protein
MADEFPSARGDTKREFFCVRQRRKGLWISLDIDSVAILGQQKKDIIMRFTTIGRLFSILVVSLLFSIVSYADLGVGIPTPSAWDNQSGSTLTINSIDSTGLITGTYINRAPGYDCQNITYPVTGWAYGTAITFNTIWQSESESCNSITAWTGFLYSGKMSTLWSLTVNGSSSTSQIVRGNDTFHQVRKLTDSSLIMKK